ncbi:MAG: carbon-nitrogen hydrolase family protein [Flavisolibacter sp.]
MKLTVAQTRPIPGNIEKNIEDHRRLIELAVSNKADLIVFPELSLTGYEPSLAKQLATDQDDQRFDFFQKTSDEYSIIIAAGMPTNGLNGIHISMIFFQPNQDRKTYSKQKLHSDEFPFFVGGINELMLNINNTKIAPAICYESLLPEHAAKAAKNGADIYMASVAKSANGISKAYKHFPKIAKQYSMIVVMSNCIGKCDNFESVGKSAIWNQQGELVGMLSDGDEGILMIDTETEVVV